MIKHNVLLFVCFVSCVNSDTTGFEFVRPTPLMKAQSIILSTNPSNPLKFNKDLEATFLTTTIAAEPNGGELVKPTPVLTGFETTGTGIPLMIEKMPISNQLTTKPMEIGLGVNLLIPTPVVNVPKEFVTDAASPLLNKVEVVPKMTTKIVEADFMNPTPVLDVLPVLETKPITIPLGNNETPELAPSTGTFIEPSHSFREGSSSVSPDVGTPIIEPQELNKVSSTELTNPKDQNVNGPCVCVYYGEEKPAAVQHPVLHFKENEVKPHFFTPDPSKWNNIRHSPNNIFQQIVSLHLNLFLNNIPVLAANVPYY